MLDFSAFDTSKIDEYAKQVKATWGQTEAYKECEKKSKDRTPEEEKVLGSDLMEIFVEFGKMKEKDPEAEEVQAQVQKLKDYITKNYYTCTNEILSGLGNMYSCGGEFTENIDKTAGEGTAEFVDRAIQVFCK